MSEELLVEEEKVPANQEATAEPEVILPEEEPIAPPEETAQKEKIDFRELIKKPLFWEIAVGVVVVLCLLIFVLVALRKPAEPPLGTEAQSFVPETTAAATVGSPPEPTYLPIDRNPIGMTDFEPTAEGFLTCVATTAA